MAKLWMKARWCHAYLHFSSFFVIEKASKAMLRKEMFNTFIGYFCLSFSVCDQQVFNWFQVKKRFICIKINETVNQWSIHCGWWCLTHWLNYQLIFILNFKLIFANIILSNHCSIKIEGVIPVRFLLNVVETRPEHFRAIRSPLVYLCGLYYPYMLPTVDSLLLSVDDELKNPEIKTITRWDIFCFNYLVCSLTACFP